MARHKHADLIHAWAEGAEIEGRHHNDEEWQSLKGADCVTWSVDCQYRIKPEKKPDVVRIHAVGAFKQIITSDGLEAAPTEQTIFGQRIKGLFSLTFSGETGELIKAEALK